MPVSADIYSQIQQPRQFEPPANPLAALAQAYQIKGLQSHIDATDRAAQTQNRLADLLRTSYDPATGAVDASKMRSGLAQAGDYAGLTNFDKTQADQAKAQRDADKARLETGLKHFEAVGQIMSGVKDQASLDAARQQAANIFGTDAARNIPTVYDPAVIARNQAQAMSVKDQLEQQYKQLTFGETQRHNQASEGLTAQGQALTARGQDMTDARTREFNSARAAEGRFPSGYEADPNKPGAVRPIAGGPADPNTPKGKSALTEGQSKALLFGSRMQEANEILDGLAKDGKTISTPGANAGYGIGAAVNLVNSASGQKLDQAKRNFINATLRKESGAAIADSEFSNANQQYFPQPGDSSEVIEQKRQNRMTAQRGMLEEVPDADARVARVRGWKPEARPDSAKRTVTRTGTLPDGRKVVQYSDGSTEYAN